eukprot:UN07374
MLRCDFYKDFSWRSENGFSCLAVRKWFFMSKSEYMKWTSRPIADLPGNSISVGIISIFWSPGHGPGL